MTDTQTEATAATTGHPSPTCDQLAAKATRLGRRIRFLHHEVENDMGSVLDGGYDGELADLSRLLFGIAAVLHLLHDTPNARITSEGMTAIQAQLDSAASIEQLDWARDILDEIDPAGT